MSTYTSVSYHTLDDPLNPKQLPNKYSDLHTLYPGRPMDSTDNPNRYAVQHENPEDARNSFENIKEQTASYGQTLERKARVGSSPKMTVNAVEDPSMIIEDPDLKGTEMLNPEDAALLTPVHVEDRKPLVENYKASDSPGKNQEQDKSGYNKWLIMALAIAALAIFVYFYATNQTDIYAF